MIIEISIKISGSGETEGMAPHSIVGHVEELDLTLKESESHVDPLEDPVAQSDQPNVPTFGADVDDSDL